MGGSYNTIRKRFERSHTKLRFKELRSYFATFLRNRGVISEYIDIVQGRIPRSVFARHYLKVEDFKALVTQVLAITSDIESSLLS